MRQNFAILMAASLSLWSESGLKEIFSLLYLAQIANHIVFVRISLKSNSDEDVYLHGGENIKESIKNKEVQLFIK